MTVNLGTIEKIANVFDVSPTYIVGWESTPPNPLAAEVKVIQGVQRFYGKDAVEYLEIYTSLSKVGRKKVQQYLDDMMQLYNE